MLLFLLLPAVLLILWKTIYKRNWQKGLEAKLTFTGGTACAGELAELTEVITNRKRMPLPELEAGFRINQGIRFMDAENTVISDYIYKRDVFSLRGMEAVTRRYRLECLKRGRYRISQIVLKTWPLFHEEQYETEISGTDELTVYAARCDVSAILAVCDTILGETESPRSLYEDPFTFASIREYTPQDPMKTINWRATARMGELMVNTFTGVRTERFFIYLDISDDRIIRQEDLVEKGISAAASLCQRLIRNGHETGLAVNTDPPTLFRPGRSRDQLRQIEQFLTEDFEKIPQLPFRTLATDFDESRDKICIYVTKEGDRLLTELCALRKPGALPGILVTPVSLEGETQLRVSKTVFSQGHL